MTDYNYAFEKYDAERMAKAVGRDISISTKVAIEICSALRRKNLQTAKALLEEVIALKRPIKYTRFMNGAGHKKGPLGAGKFPVKASTALLKLLSLAEINAQNKGLNTGQLTIIHICAQKASRPMHYGRKGRSEFKRSHVELVVAEEKQKAKEKKPARAEAKPAPVKKEAPAAKPAEKRDVEAPKAAEAKKEAKVEAKEKAAEPKKEAASAIKKIEAPKESPKEESKEAQEDKK